jgi:beta-xylosidase
MATPTTAPPPPGDVASPALITTPNENLPDPFILKVPGGYELYASQTGLYGPTIPTAFSTTIYHWPAAHAAIPVLPAWATFGFTWAPDVRHLDGRYVMYFDSLVQPSVYFDRSGSGFSQYAQCIGVATSSAPGGPFVGQSRPLICDLGSHGAIDPRTFLAPDGRLYLDWKSDNNAANPAPFSPTNLYAQPLSPSGLSLTGPAHLLLSADAPWQEGIIEAPDMVQVRGRYRLFYSGSWFNGPRYGIGVASCVGPTGPCTDRSLAGPWIGTNDQGSGPGEESILEDPSGQWWMAYSPWYFGYLGGTNRPVAMAPLGFGADGPYVAKPPARTGAT